MPVSCTAYRSAAIGYRLQHRQLQLQPGAVHRYSAVKISTAYLCSTGGNEELEKMYLEQPVMFCGKRENAKR